MTVCSTCPITSTCRTVSYARRVIFQKLMWIGIVALEAGCSQKPSQKALIGLTGSIFNTEIVTVSAPLSPDDPKLKPKNESENLPMQAIIGIIVGAVVITLMIVGVVGYKCFKKRKARKLEAINSTCHSRFGAVDIPAPLDGAYSEYKPEPVVEFAQWDEDYMMKEIRTDSRTSGHSKVSSISSEGSSERLNPERGHARNNSGLGDSTHNDRPQEASMPSQEQPVQQERLEPGLQPRARPTAVSPVPELNSTHINPLRMNSYTGPSGSVAQPKPSVAAVGVAITAPVTRDTPTPPQFIPAPPRSTPTPPHHTPTPPLAQPQARSARQSHIPPPLNLQNAHAYVPGAHIQHSPRPGYASSIISSTSTTFSPDVYHSPPPSYQSPVGATFNHHSAQRREQTRPAAPLPTYNPADYAPKPTNPYHQLQPQFNTQHRSYSPAPAQSSRLAFHRPQRSVASTSSRFSFVPSTHAPSQPPPPRPQTKHQSVPKQKDSAVPIISLPIPAPKRQTVDLRNLVGMNLKQHISPENDEVPAMPKLKGQDVELPKGLDRTESLLAKSSPPFRSLARNLNPEAAMTLPPAEKAAPPGLDEGTIQVQRPDSRASYRGRSASRPRRESLPQTHDSQRDRSGNRLRYRSRSRDVDLEGGDGRKKKAFSFGFRGQDAASAVDERSPQSGATTDVEQWPGKM